MEVVADLLSQHLSLHSFTHRLELGTDGIATAHAPDLRDDFLDTLLVGRSYSLSHDDIPS